MWVFLMLRLSDFDAVTFDVYGTLIDWEPSIVAFLSEWAGEVGVKASGEDLIMSFDRARQKSRRSALLTSIRRCFAAVSTVFPASSV